MNTNAQPETKTASKLTTYNEFIQRFFPNRGEEERTKADLNVQRSTAAVSTYGVR
ncbi:hypothetical protein AB4Y89_08070 [Terriglobus sp. 2YAB30_2]|uniref:hypothetical protein n=1 Tax=Terriglobus sp. 2YAB30_2 TaxID=3233023 RepID=UPI003F9BBCCD